MNTKNVDGKERVGRPRIHAAQTLIRRILHITMRKKEKTRKRLVNLGREKQYAELLLTIFLRIVFCIRRPGKNDDATFAIFSSLYFYSVVYHRAIYSSERRHHNV